jgi:hypothetical protein
MTKTLCLWPHKIRQDQATEDGDYKRTHFCNWLLWAVHDILLDPKLTFSFTDEASFDVSGYINAQNTSSINSRQTFAVPVHNQKTDTEYAITAT